MRYCPDDSFVLNLVNIPSNIQNVTVARLDTKSGFGSTRYPVKVLILSDITAKIRIMQYLYYKPDYIGLDILGYIANAESVSIWTSDLKIRIEGNSASRSIVYSKIMEPHTDHRFNSNRIELVTIPGQGPIFNTDRTRQMLDAFEIDE